MNAIPQSEAVRRAPEAMLAALRDRFGDRFSVAEAVRLQHGRDESPYPPMPPEAVVHVLDTPEIAWVAQLCNQYHVPLIPYGAGSSLEGHVLAVHGGICLNVSKMNHVLAVNTDDMTATVQAGVTRKQLNEELKS